MDGGKCPRPGGIPEGDGVDTFGGKIRGGEKVVEGKTGPSSIAASI